MKSLNLPNKKGNVVASGILMMVVLLIFIITIFTTEIFMDDINTDFQSDSDMSAEAKAVMTSYNTDYPTFWDNTFFFAFVLLWAVMLIGAYFIDQHPIMFVITFILMIFMLMIAVYLGNAYEEIADDTGFNLVSPNYPKANLIMENLLLVMVVIAFSVAIVMYGKNKYG